MIQISRINVEIPRDVYKALKKAKSIEEKRSVLLGMVNKANHTETIGLAYTWLMDKSNTLTMKLDKKEDKTDSSNPLIEEYTKSWFVILSKHKRIEE